jgi:hypothetical protein
MKQIFVLEHGFVIAVVMAYLAFLSLTLTLYTKKIHAERGGTSPELSAFS